MATTVGQRDRRDVALLNELHLLDREALRTSDLRVDIYEALREVLMAIETPLDAARRISFSPMILATAKIAVDLDLFSRLNSHDGPVSTATLASEAGEDKDLLGRLLRHLASYGLATQCTSNSFASSHLTRAFVNPGFQGSISHHFDAQSGPWMSLPRYLKETEYQNPVDPAHTAFQLGHGTTLTPEAWAREHPEALQSLSQWMAVQRQGEASWLDVFPAEQLAELASSQSSAPLFVDIGGGIGHQCMQLRARYPTSPRRIVLQDVASVIRAASSATTDAKIECTAHDMWTPQPHVGASIYYMRNVVHDFPDARAATLLRTQAAAMSESSILVVDEIVLLDDDQAPHWHAADLDIAMMASLAGAERTAMDWKRLFEESGLALQKSLRYSRLGHTAMILVSDRGRE